MGVFDKLVKKIRAGYVLSDEEIDRLNPPYPNDEVGGVIHNASWLPVGYIPAPRTRFGWMFYHLIHGLWMRYPFWKVMLFALDFKRNADELLAMNGELTRGDILLIMRAYFDLEEVIDFRFRCEKHNILSVIVDEEKYGEELLDKLLDIEERIEGYIDFRYIPAQRQTKIII